MGLRAAAPWSAVQAFGGGGVGASENIFNTRQESGLPPAYAGNSRVSMQARSRHTRAGSRCEIPASGGGRKQELRQQRAELEQDVAQLRSRLIKEENVHKALQRAFNRPIGALPRVPQYLPPKTRKLLAEVAVLEEEVVRLEDRILYLQQDLTDEAVFTSMFSKEQKEAAVALMKPRPVFTVGDSKRAAPVKKDVLIAQLLPAVVDHKDDQTNRSVQKKKGLQVRKASAANEQRTSPASDQACTGEKKNMHKSQLLNSNGCVRGVREKYFGISTNKLAVIQEEEREKENMQQLKQQQHEELTRVADEHPEPNPEAERREPETKLGSKAPTKSPAANKVSEELVRCLMGIYGMMTRLYTLSDSDTSSIISRSTFSSFSSQSNNSKTTSCTSSKISTPNNTEFLLDMDRRDPYGVCQDLQPRDIGPYRHFQNIAADSFDYSRIPNSASLFRRLRTLIGKLANVEVHDLSPQQKLAFWINVYNACMMHAFLEYGIPCGPHQVVGLMRKATLNVGGHSLNALAIEHFILRLPSHSKHAFVKITSKDKANIQSSLGLDWPEPLVSFALCCGSKSSPAVRVYTAAEVESELEVAKKEYLQAAVGVSSKGKVLIPKLLDWNMRDFAKDRESLLDWICDQLPEQLRTKVQECTNRASGSSSTGTGGVIQVMPYDFNFRYLLTV